VLPIAAPADKMPSGSWLHGYDELYCVTSLAIAFCEEGSLNRRNVRLPAIVYDEILNTLAVTDRTAPRAQVIARKLIELAQAGERDPECLKEMTIEAVQVNSSLSMGPSADRGAALPNGISH
jgi:hypothetical protein